MLKGVGEIIFPTDDMHGREDSLELNGQCKSVSKFRLAIANAVERYQIGKLSSTQNRLP